MVKKNLKRFLSLVINRLTPNFGILRKRFPLSKIHEYSYQSVLSCEKINCPFASKIRGFAIMANRSACSRSRFGFLSHRRRAGLVLGLGFLGIGRA
jgi:hypothetical protein